MKVLSRRTQDLREKHAMYLGRVKVSMACFSPQEERVPRFRQIYEEFNVLTEQVQALASLVVIQEARIRDLEDEG